MSIRWRKTGELVCGAKSLPMEGDTYIDDGVQYRLSIDVGMIIPDESEAETGLWHWTYPIIPFTELTRSVMIPADRLHAILNEYAKLNDSDVDRMIPTMRDFLIVGQIGERREKFMRWLGFLQGVLYQKGIYTIDEMRIHNKYGIFNEK